MDKRFTLKTNRHSEMIEITPTLEQWLREMKVKEGILTASRKEVSLFKPVTGKTQG